MNAKRKRFIPREVRRHRLCWQLMTRDTPLQQLMDKIYHGNMSVRGEEEARHRQQPVWVSGPIDAALKQRYRERDEP